MKNMSLVVENVILKHVLNVKLKLMVINRASNFLKSNMEIGFRKVPKHMFAQIVDAKSKKMEVVHI